MSTFNDFKSATDKEAFIVKSVKEYRESDTYVRAATAQEYYSTNNTTIVNRMGYLERQMRNKVNIKFHRLRNSFFQKAVKRLVLYLMGNGAPLDNETKAKIDRKFDSRMIIAAINACVDGVVWGFPDLDRLTFFRATEFVPLMDERTGNIMAGIRFWQINSDKPMYIEFYEIDGITEYETDKGGENLKEIASKRAYRQTIRKDAFSTTVINGENYGVLPIFPLYANELGTSELTAGLQALIDAYDFVSSDWVDNTTLVEGLYGILKNYGGQEASGLLAEIQQLHVMIQDGDDTSADLKTVEMPFQSRQKLLDFLEARMYSDWLLPSEMRLGGARAVTATEIKAAREDMDIKADLLEWQVAEFIESVLRLKGIDELLQDFKRRTNNNDSETVQNIATQLSNGWIDEQEAIMLDPTILDDRKEDLMQRINLRNAQLDEMRFPITKGVSEDAEPGI